MDAATLPLEAYDPYRPPSWRWELAQRLARSDAAFRDRYNDPALITAVDFLTAGNGPQEIARALALFERQDPLPWEIDARILGGQTDVDLAERFGVSPEVLAYYRPLFFDVRANSVDYVRSRVIGSGLFAGFARDDLAGLWKAYGFFGGPLVLDTVVTAFYSVWEPGTPPSIDVYFTPGSTASLPLQAHIAIRSLPVTPDTERALMEIHTRLLEAQQLGSQRRRDSAMTELQRDVIRMYHEGPGFLRRRQKTRNADTTVPATNPRNVMDDLLDRLRSAASPTAPNERSRA